MNVDGRLLSIVMYHGNTCYEDLRELSPCEVVRYLNNLVQTSKGTIVAVVPIAMRRWVFLRELELNVHLTDEYMFVEKNMFVENSTLLLQVYTLRRTIWVRPRLLTHSKDFVVTPSQLVYYPRVIYIRVYGEPRDIGRICDGSPHSVGIPGTNTYCIHAFTARTHDYVLNVFQRMYQNQEIYKYVKYTGIITCLSRHEIYTLYEYGVHYFDKEAWGVAQHYEPTTTLHRHCDGILECDGAIVEI